MLALRPTPLKRFLGERVQNEEVQSASVPRARVCEGDASAGTVVADRATGEASPG